MRTLVVLACLTALTACVPHIERPSRKNYRLHLEEPDIVRDNKIGIGDRRDAVEKKIGPPALATQRSDNGREVSEVEYVTKEKLWRPPTTGEAGVWEDVDEEPGAKVHTTTRLRMLYFDGVLVAIHDPARKTFTAAQGVVEGMTQEELDRLLKDFREGR